jgi:trk system potassium uptake protein
MARHNVKSEYAVIGLGRFGTSVARTLVERGFTVLGIDRDMRIVQELADEITQTVALDGTDEDALRAVDIALYPTVVIAIGADFQSKLLTALTIKSIGTNRVICTAFDEREKAILLKIGADDVVMPEFDSGRRLALSLIMPSLLDHLPLGRGYSVGEVHSPASFAGMTVRDKDLRRLFGLTLIAIRRGDEVFISPPTDHVYQPDDQLIIIGRIEDLDRLSEFA